MAYVPKDWVTGEVITETALDHIEQGIANASSVAVISVNASGTAQEHTYTLNKNYNEIKEYLNNGILPIAVLIITNGANEFAYCYPVNQVVSMPETDRYYVTFHGFTEDGTISGTIVQFEANSPTGALTSTNIG